MQVQNKFNFPISKYEYKVSNAAFTGNPISDKFSLTTDNDLEFLNNSAQKFKQSGNIKDRNELFKAEEKILWQEVENPAKYLFRAVKTGALFPLPQTFEDQTAKLRCNALSGLCAQYATFKRFNLPIEDIGSKFSIIEKIFNETTDNMPDSQRNKSNINLFIGVIYDLLPPEQKIKVDKLHLKSLGNSGNPIENYKNAQNIQDKTKALIQLGEQRHPALKSIFPELIKNDKEMEHSQKLTALWCMGRVKTEQCFEYLVQTINSGYPESNAKKLEAEEEKEMALHSLTLYVKKYPDEVKNILQKISKSDDFDKDLAKILLDKAEGNFNKKDYILNSLIPDINEQQKYKKIRARYVPEIDTLSPKFKNKVDEALIPWKKNIESLCDKGLKMHIIDGTVTLMMKNLIGSRVGDGRFWDTIPGQNEPTLGIILDSNRLNMPDNALSHELMHSIHRSILDKEDNVELERIYQKAAKENKCLDEYAASTSGEYLAKGAEAYMSLYKPHSGIICNNDNIQSSCYHSKSGLKRLDPDLYNFIEHCIQKYEKTSKIKRFFTKLGLN